MRNVYEQMLDREGFATEQHITQGLFDHVSDAMNGYGIYQPREEQESSCVIVEGIASAIEGIDCVYYDIPNHGRVTTRNAEPPFPMQNLVTARIQSVTARSRVFCRYGIEEQGTYFNIFHSFQNLLLIYRQNPELWRLQTVR